MRINLVFLTVGYLSPDGGGGTRSRPRTTSVRRMRPVSRVATQPQHDWTELGAAFWNRQTGSLDSFPRYSSALRSSEVVWNDAILDDWIKDPQHLVPGNTMTFQGISDGKERADLLAFLNEATQPEHAPPRTSCASHQLLPGFFA